MIFNENKIYAKVWKVTHAENGKYIDLQITTSEKGSDGSYINSSWFPRAIGKSVNTLKDVKREDRIIITKSKFTNERKDTDNGIKSYFRFIILEAVIDGADKKESKNTPAAEGTNKEQSKQTADTEDSCPW